MSDPGNEPPATFLLYSIRGRPVLAVPEARPEIRMQALDRFQTYTARRRLYRSLMRTAIRLHLDQFLAHSRTADTLIDCVDFPALLRELQSAAGLDTARVCVHWPVNWTRGRFYLHTFDAQGQPVAFVKCSTSAPAERELQKESSALSDLQTKSLGPMRVPKLLARGQFRNCSYLAEEALPRTLASGTESWKTLEPFVQRYAQPCEKVAAEALLELPYARHLPGLWETSHFFSELHTVFGGEVSICRVHGDLTVANVARRDGEIWLLDWEQSVDNGPHLTDEISYYISLNRRDILFSPADALQEFARHYLPRGDPHRRRDAMLALEFLRASGRDDARALIDAWPPLSDSVAAPSAPSKTGALSAAAPSRNFALPPLIDSSRPLLAIVSNSFTPYRLHFHRRIVAEVDSVELASIYTHGESNSPWAPQQAPETNPVLFGQHEPTRQQDRLYRALHEWHKGGRIIRWLARHRLAAVLVGGYNDLGRLRIIRWCWKHGVPCGLVADSNIRGDRPSAWIAPLKRLLVSYVVHRCRWIFPCGTLGAAYFKKYGASDEQIHFLPYEPDYELVRAVEPADRNPVAQRFGLVAGRQRIIYSGRLVPVKRVDLIIEAFVAISEARPDWDLLIIGDGPLRGALEAKVPLALLDRVIWTGFIDSQPMISSLYRASDVLVLASDFEPWALVVNEAVAAGLAVVSSDMVGAAAELVQDSVNGRIFPAGNLQALADALLDVTLPERLSAMKVASAKVLSSWQQRADPVDGLRRALLTAGTSSVRASPATA